MTTAANYLNLQLNNHKDSKRNILLRTNNMDLRNEIIDVISSIQMLDNHYETIIGEMSDKMEYLRGENTFLIEHNELLDQKIDALAKHLGVKLEQPDTTIRAVKLDEDVANNQ
jgi:hypothetical protein